VLGFTRDTYVVHRGLREHGRWSKMYVLFYSSSIWFFICCLIYLILFESSIIIYTRYAMVCCNLTRLDCLKAQLLFIHVTPWYAVTW